MRHLKTVVLVAVGLALLLFPAVAPASALDCESIRDPDQRHFCRAVANHDKLECEFIKRNDLKQECRALAGSKR